MDAKKFFAFFAVFVMVLAPLAVVANDIDAGTAKGDVNETGVMVKLKNVNYDKFKELLTDDYADLNGYEIIQYGLYGLDVYVFNTEDVQKNKWTFGDSNFEFSEYSKMVVGEKEVVEECYSYDYKNLDIEFELKTEKTGRDFIGYTTYGEAGKKLYEMLDGKTFAAGTKITIKGDFSYSWSDICEYGYGSVADGKYAEKSYAYKAPEKMVSNLTVKFGDLKEIKFEVNFNYVYNSSSDYSYNVDMEKVKVGDKQYSLYKNSREYNLTEKITVDSDTKKGEYKYREDYGGDGYFSSYDVTADDLLDAAYFDFESETNSLTKLKLTNIIKAESEDKAKEIVKAIKDCDCSNTPSDASKACDEIYNEAAGKSGNSDNTMTVVAIVVVVIVILALVALWYFKFKPEGVGKKPVEEQKQEGL